MRNVHERLVPAPLAVVGPLLDRIGGPDDPLWPSPQWPPMVLDRPAAPGAAGGHGPIRYRVTGHQPQRWVEFTLDPGQGLHGTHTLSARAAGPSSTLLRHEIDGRASGAMRWAWPLAVRWLHDAVVEDLLDRAESAVGTGPERPARWSAWVRLLRRWESPRAREVPVPDTPLLATALPRVDWADAHAITVSRGAPSDPQVWADAIFADPPRWVAAVLAVRDGLVRLLGSGHGERSSFGTVARGTDEVLLGADEGSADFRASVLREQRRVVVSTVVALHDRRGRAYFALVRHVHPVLVRALLRHAAGTLSRSSNAAGREYAIMGG